MSIKRLIILGAIITTLATGTAYAAELFYDSQSFYSTTLTSSISSSAVLAPVTTVPSVDSAFLVLEPRTSNQEIVLYNGRGGNSLYIRRGLATYGTTTATSTNAKPHAAGTRVEIADVHFYTRMIQNAKAFQYRGATTTTAKLAYFANIETNDIAFVTDDQRFYKYSGSAWVKQGDNDETIGGAKSFSATSTLEKGALIGSSAYDCQTGASTLAVCSKGYIDDQVSAGAANADQTTKGIVEEATPAEINSFTQNGGTGARLFVNPNDLQYTTFASSTNAATSTTANTWYSTTTITDLLPNKIYDVDIYIGTTTATHYNPSYQYVAQILFNNSRLDNIKSVYVTNGAAVGGVTANYMYIPSSAGVYPSYIHLTIDNLTDHYRVGQYQASGSLVDSAYPFGGTVVNGSFNWATTTPITSISVGLYTPSPNEGQESMSSTTIRVLQR